MQICGYFWNSKICELSIQPRDFPLKYINRTESLIGGKINTVSHVSFCIFSILMKNYKNKLQNSSLLNVMRNFDQSNTLPEFDLELFIHCGVELAR